ncbi:hypothetical protein [Paraburkholderia sp. SIMBA_030]|uniref:hypothetical protein n=1 Tax=Paraburkholderia sp. SIMBA_030 TaxID=3085773 RepID=UPI00397E3842
MNFAHVALWTRDLDEAALFWRRYFDAYVGVTCHKFDHGPVARQCNEARDESGPAFALIDPLQTLDPAPAQRRLLG